MSQHIVRCVHRDFHRVSAQEKRLNNLRRFEEIAFSVLGECARGEPKCLDAGVYKIPSKHHDKILTKRHEFAQVFLEYLLELKAPDAAPTDAATRRVTGESARAKRKSFLDKMEEAYDAAVGACDEDTGGSECDGESGSEAESVAMFNLARYDIVLRLSRSLRYDTGRGVFQYSEYWTREVETLEYCIEHDKALPLLGMYQDAWKETP
jgi:hypothetical protein